MARYGLDSTKRWIHYLLWAYLLALLFDGALRKWVFPELSDFLLLSRVPIVLLIYVLALRARLFPWNGFVVFAIFLSVVTMAAGYSAHGNLMALGFGALSNFFFIPLMFLFPKVWDWVEVEKVGRFVMVVAIPMTVLIGLQFYSPQSAWVNLSVGGGEGAGYTGGLGRYRPPGTFSFITGLAQFYTLVFAFLLHQFMHRRTLPMPLVLLCGICLPLAVFGSISRLLALSILVVFVLAAFALFYNGRRLPNSFKLLAAMTVCLALASQTSFFHDATHAFSERWERSTGEDRGGVREAIIGRTVGELTLPFTKMREYPFWGYGLGTGTQAGAQLMTGERGFTIAEGEWGRVMGELGPLFGTAFILLRLGLIFFLARLALREVLRGNFLPWVIFASTFLLVLYGQWGQQTSLGFAILGGGLALSACRTPQKDDEDEDPDDDDELVEVAMNGKEV